MRWTTALLLCCLVPGMPGQAAEGDEPDRKPTRMYKWVDADGVVQYSATPVEGQDTTVIEIRRGPKPQPAPDPASLRPKLDCSQLRENVRLLEGDSQFLQVIENGVPRALTEEERLPQLEAAKVGVKNCEAAEAAAAAGEAPPQQ